MQLTCSLSSLILPKPIAQDPEDIIGDVLEKDLRPAFPNAEKSGIKNLAIDCWTRNPLRRPNFSEIIKLLEVRRTSLAGKEREEMREWRLVPLRELLSALLRLVYAVVSCPAICRAYGVRI